MIYFLQPAGQTHIKIGYTKDLKRRINELQTSCPYKLVLLGMIEGDISIEQHIHKHLQHYRLGGEWFRGTNFVIEYIKHYPNYQPTHIATIQHERTDGKREKVTTRTPSTQLSKLMIIEKELIGKMLNEHGNNKLQTAKTLNMSRSTLYAKIRKYNINYVHFLRKCTE